VEAGGRLMRCKVQGEESPDSAGQDVPEGEESPDSAGQDVPV